MESQLPRDESAKLKKKQPKPDPKPAEPGKPPKLTDLKRHAIVAMASQGMAPAQVAAILGIAVEDLGQLPEWRLGIIEGQRISSIERVLAGPPKAQVGAKRRAEKDLSPTQRTFLAAYRETFCCKTDAAKAAGIRRELHYRWMEEPKYRQAFAKAHEEAAGNCEDMAARRATLGRLRPIFSYGKLVGHELEPSDQLLSALLKAEFPDKYRERVTTTQEDETSPEAVELSKLLTKEQLLDVRTRMQERDKEAQL